MSYETTTVPVWRTQGEISRLVMARGRTGVELFGEPPREGFQGRLAIGGVECVIRITARCRPAPDRRKPRRDSPYAGPTTAEWRPAGASR